MIRPLSILLLLLTAGAGSVCAEVKLPAIFSDHMVLQGDAAVNVWGWAEPGETVSVSMAGQTKTVTTDANGKWALKLDRLKAGAEPQTLTVKGSNTLTIHDVLVGEVWLCSGQSNMEMQVKGGMHGQVDNADEEIAAAKYPEIRMFVFRQTYDIYELPAAAGHTHVRPARRVAGMFAGNGRALFRRRPTSLGATCTGNSGRRWD